MSRSGLPGHGKAGDERGRVMRPLFLWLQATQESRTGLEPRTRAGLQNLTRQMTTSEEKQKEGSKEKRTRTDLPETQQPLNGENEVTRIERRSHE